MGLLSGGARIIYESFMTYSAGNRIWLLYFAALIYLCIAGGKDARRLILYPLILQAVTIFNPVVAGELVVHFGFAERYLRVLWMIEFFIVGAWAFVHLIARLKNRAVKGCALAGMLALVVLLGNPVFFGKDVPAYRPSPNCEFTGDDIVALAKVIHSENIQRPRVLYDGYLMLNYRIYDPSVRSFMNRKRFLKLLKTDEQTFEEKKYLKKKNLKNLMRVYFYGNTSVPYKDFLKAGKKRKLDYVVLTVDSALNDYMEKAGLTKIGSTEEYHVWRFPTAKSVKK